MFFKKKVESPESSVDISKLDPKLFSSKKKLNAANLEVIKSEPRIKLVPVRDKENNSLPTPQSLSNLKNINNAMKSGLEYGTNFVRKRNFKNIFKRFFSFFKK